MKLFDRKISHSAVRTYLLGIRINKQRGNFTLLHLEGRQHDCDGCMNIVATPRQLESDAKEFLRGFDAENTAKAKRIIEKLKSAWARIKRKKLYAGHEDFFQKAEIEKFKKMITRNGLKNCGDYYEYNGYKLTRPSFEPSIFHDEYDLKHLKPMDKKLAILDIGAFIGDSSLILARHFPDNPIYAIEAIPSLFAEIKKNAELNGAKNIIPVNLAMSDRKESIELFYEGAVEKCESDTLDNFVRKNKIKVGLIKIDIEGAEWAMLKGAMETIKQQRPTLIISIYHNYRDLMKIKPLIDSLNLGYEFSLTDSCYGVYPIHEITLNCEVRK